MNYKALFMSILFTLDIISLLVLMMTESIIFMAITFVIGFYYIFKLIFELESSDSNG